MVAVPRNFLVLEINLFTSAMSLFKKATDLLLFLGYGHGNNVVCCLLNCASLAIRRRSENSSMHVYTFRVYAVCLFLCEFVFFVGGELTFGHFVQIHLIA